ncbi:MAG: hypothetical protein KGN78_11665 [Actinomycetales bacterium]|nr:hypothetical protein [Actinomycetales bacterium]
MPQAIAVPASVASIDRLTLAVDAVRGADASVSGQAAKYGCFADDAE